jgi:hypothetical protein
MLGGQWSERAGREKGDTHSNADCQQDLVEGIAQGVDAFGEHGRGACGQERPELDRRDLRTTLSSSTRRTARKHEREREKSNESAPRHS